MSVNSNDMLLATKSLDGESVRWWGSFNCLKRLPEFMRRSWGPSSLVETYMGSLIWVPA